MSEWDGRPLNPERDGWHWLRTPDGMTAPYEWRAAGECERGRWPSGWVEEGETEWPALECTYLGPALTPAELAAERAAAWRAGRDAAAGIADIERDRLKTLALSLPAAPGDIVPGNRTERLRDAIASRAGTASEIAAAIRALPAPEGDASALAALLAEADAWRVVAKIAEGREPTSMPHAMQAAANAVFWKDGGSLGDALVAALAAAAQEDSSDAG